MVLQMMDGSGKEESSSSSGSASTAVKEIEPVANCNSTHNKNNNNLNGSDADVIRSNTTKEEIHTSNIQNNVSTEVRQISEESPLFEQALESLSQQAATSSPQSRQQSAASVHPISTTTTNTTVSSITYRRSMNDSPPNIQNLEESYFNKSPTSNNNNTASNIKPDISTSNNIETNNNGNHTTTTTSPPPSEENITQLTNMGFNRDEVIDALQHTDNSIDAAADRLLNNVQPTKTESVKEVSQSPTKRKKSSPKKKNSTLSNKSEVIDLLDDSSDSDDDNMEDRKMPAKKKNVGNRSIEMEEESDSDSDWEEDSKMPAAKKKKGDTKVKSESSSSPVARARSTEDTNIPTRDESTKLKSAESSSAADSETFEADLAKAMKLSKEEERKSKERAKQIEEGTYTGLCHILDRQEFKRIVDEVVEVNGGYEKIEAGSLVQTGNGDSGYTRSAVTGGSGLRNQTRAQYGRYSIERLWRVFDVLEGKEDIEIKEEADEEGEEVTTSSPKRKKQKLDAPKRLEGGKMKAFLDIGHGIGIQVIQAGWSQSVPSRGVEIVKDRHLIAEGIYKGVLDRLRSHPPDSTLAELRLNDFVPAITEGDEELNSFLLFKDKPLDVQKGLVIFVNNAEEVFAARSNGKGNMVSLDYRLAQLFAQMEVGGRMVTLTDVSGHCQSGDWFTRKVFKSGTGAVSWGCHNKSIDVFVLIKTKETWTCQNTKCPYLGLGEGGYPIPLLDEDGDFLDKCTFCGIGAKRCGRVRKPTRKAS